MKTGKPRFHAGERYILQNKQLLQRLLEKIKTPASYFPRGGGFLLAVDAAQGVRLDVHPTETPLPVIALVLPIDTLLPTVVELPSVPRDRVQGEKMPKKAGKQRSHCGCLYGKL